METGAPKGLTAKLPWKIYHGRWIMCGPVFTAYLTALAVDLFAWVWYTYCKTMDKDRFALYMNRGIIVEMRGKNAVYLLWRHAGGGL